MAEENPNLKEFVKKQIEVQSLENFKKEAEKQREKELVERGRAIEKKEKIVIINKKNESVKKKLGEAGIFLRVLGGRIAGKKRLSDRIKVLRFQNRLEKLRLQNTISRFRLQKRVEKLRAEGKLPIPKPTIPPISKAFLPYFNPTTEADINSMFHDTNPAKNDMWGEESYFGDEYGIENYYPEDFYGTEFDNDPFFHLGIKPRVGVNPLLW